MKDAKVREIHLVGELDEAIRRSQLMKKQIRETENRINAMQVETEHFFQKPIESKKDLNLRFEEIKSPDFFTFSDERSVTKPFFFKMRLGSVMKSLRLSKSGREEIDNFFFFFFLRLGFPVCPAYFGDDESQLVPIF